MTKRNYYPSAHCIDRPICAQVGKCLHGCPPPEGDSSYSELIENPGVLDKAQKLVDGRDKSDHYGPPEEFMRRLAKMWGGYLDQDLKPTDAAMMMALLKAARLRTNPDHEDSLVDFAGYARIYERVK